jgi:threonine aldolase
MTIDLRSDTVTKPTPAMREFMFSAEIGDDVFEEDPTVNHLEELAANMFGKESSLFCPSGTMTNQIGIRINTSPQDEVICDKRAHIYNYEGGGIAYNSLISCRLVDGDRGRFTAQDVVKNINPDDIHYPVTKLVSIENTVNKGGGCYYRLNQVKDIRRIAEQHQLNMHLDGARFFNAWVETKENIKEWGKCFETISICLSKGLGAPVGSLLVGSAEKIKQAKRVRKTLGGGMRQAGFLAAAGVYALKHHIDRLTEDHIRARSIGDMLSDLPWVTDVTPVETNIVIFSIDEGLAVRDQLAKLQAKDILAIPFGPRDIRMVTHLDINDQHLNELHRRLKQI